MLEGMEQHMEGLSVVTLTGELQFLTHTVHTLLVYYQDVQIVNDLKDETFVIYAFYYLRADAPAEFVSLLDYRKFAQDLLRVIFGLGRVFVQKEY
jgi:hypothetical protein